MMPDVNVLIYAHRRDSHDEHLAYAAWLESLATGDEPFALSGLSLVGVARVVTNPRIFRPPSSLDEVFAFMKELVERPNARLLAPGPRHLKIWEKLCRDANATGKLAADAQHAAMAIEHGCTWVSTDSDFDRFSGLRWQHPLA